MPVDFLCYTPREFEIGEKQMRIVKEAVENNSAGFDIIQVVR